MASSLALVANRLGSASVVAPDPRNAGARHDLSEQADAAHVECEGTGLTAGDHEPDLPDA